jgi:ribosomal protein S18 acetylase RimI-like enzyme
MTEVPRLDTGYGSTTPAGDNLLNDFVQECAESFAAFARARGDRVERIAGLATMVDAGSPLPFVNRVLLEQPITDPTALVARIHDFYAAGPPTPFLLDSAWPTPDLTDAGFTLMGHPPLMLRPPDVPLPPPPPELRIVRVDDDRSAFDYELALIDGYPAPMLQPMTEVTIVTPAALDAAGWHHFVGYVDGRPVASGAAYVDNRLVRVDNIATLEDVRGHGYGRAMTAAAAGVDPGKPAALVASDLGRRVYERLGFVAMLRITYWLGSRSR